MRRIAICHIIALVWLVLPRGLAQTQYLPQVAVGGDAGGINFVTTLFLVNNSSEQVSGAAELFAGNGLPLEVSIDGAGMNSRFAWSLAAGEMRRFKLTGGTITSGWMRIIPDGEKAIGASAIFQLLEGEKLVSQAGVLPSPPLQSATIVYDSLGQGTNTGVAIANPNDQPNDITVGLFDKDGKQVASLEFTLPARGHLARFVTELFPNIRGIDEMEGSLAIKGSLAFSALALRFEGLEFTATPVIGGARPITLASTEAGRFIAFTYFIPMRTADAKVALYDRKAKRVIALPEIDDPFGVEGDPSITADGRLIAFTTDRSSGNILLFDVENRSFIDLPGMNDPAWPDSQPSISADGRFIAFSSQRRSRDPQDVFLYDRLTAQLDALPELNGPPGTPQGHPTISGDGRFIVVESNILFDRQTRTVTRLPVGGVESSISADGRFLVFAARSGDRQLDVFLFDIQKNSLVPLPGLNDPSANDRGPSISSDGRFIAFESERGGRATVLLYDRLTGLLVPLPGLDDPGAEEGLPSIS